MRHALVLLLAACSPMKVVFDDTQVDTAIGVDDDTGPTLFPELVVDPTSLDLGVVAPLEEVSGIVTVGNDGAWPMVVSVSVTEGAEWFRADATDFTVAPGASSNVRITFAAADIDAYEGTLHLTTDDPDEPVVDVLLTAAVAQDDDGDGYPEGEDCDDDDASVYPGAEETWYDGIDANCDGADDYDQDGDGSRYGDDCDDTDPNAYPGNDETWYDGIDGDCSSGSDYDQDGDGWDSADYGGEDCDDTEATANPGTFEAPDDGIDNDCDGEVDEALSTVDVDGDGYTEATGDCDETDAGINPSTAEIWYDGIDQNCDGNDTDQDGDGWPLAYDCDDENAAANPDAVEVWYDGVDEDCDGLSDYDQDLDGYDTTDSGGADCDDGDFGVNPGATDTPYDGVDTDCSGGSDNDADGDGYDSVDYGGTDCDDTDDGVNPGAVESYYDGVDANCDGLSDYDADVDGQDSDVYGGADCNDADATVNTSATDTWYDGIDQDCDGASDYDQDADGEDASAYGGTDCDDTDATINTGATESWYDGVDQDCDGNDDDQDGDGYASDVTGGTDCDDTDASVNPGAVDVVYDGVDQDCDGGSDYDADGDGFASSTYGGTDCNDAAARVNPAATETCDSIDNDCDGTVDDGVTTTYYQDSDGDGYGNPSVTSAACSAPAGYVSTRTDCDDTSAAVSPADVETCNSVDDDCDGTVDDGVTTTYYLDADSDGYGLSTSTRAACSLPAGYSTLSTDCNDANAAVSPADAEVCNSTDDDCDGSTDEGVTTTYYRDADSDGYGLSTVTIAACSLPSGYSTLSTDCNDSSASISPGDPEVCNSTDDDCDGSTDEGVSTTYYRDADSDGYGVSTSTTTGCSLPTGYSTLSTDCNDSSASISPGDPEVCNSLDDDCDGSTDEGLSTSTYYLDSDGDGYGTTSGTTTACSAPSGYSSVSTDCDDADATSNPGATEIGYDIADNDCDGYPDDMLAETESGWTVRGARASDGIGGWGVHAEDDLDGDGDPELVICAGSANSSTSSDLGYLAFHDADTAGLDIALTSGAYYFYGSNAGDFTGNAFAVIDDLDSGGVAEFAVGSYQNDSNQDQDGQAYIFDAGSASGGEQVSSTYSDGVVRGVTDDGNYGYALAAGDFDGDGTNDLAGGAPGEQNAKGRVYVTFYRNGLGWADIDDTSSTFYMTGVSNSDHLGYSVDFGDFNDDGYDDLVACSPDDDDGGTSSGVCWVVNGASTRDTASVSGTTVSSLDDAKITGSAASDQAGLLPHSLAVGDLDDDGRDDLAVGVSGYDGYTSGGGGVWVYTGGSLSGSETYATANYLIRGDGSLGASVSFGDVTGDGTDDLLAGAITAGTGGRVYLFEGGQAAGTYTLPTSQYASWDGEASGDLFGTAISGLRDLDLDGVPDFAVAAPGNDDVASAAGKVYVLPAYP